MKLSRWELGKIFPNRSTALRLLEIAKEKGVSSVCLNTLENALFPKAEVSYDRPWQKL